MAQPTTTASAWPDEPVPLSLDTAPVPAYGSGSLADLLPTLAAGLGVPDFEPRIAELAPADRVCVFLIDGLGWEQVRAHPAEAPFLTSLLGSSRGGTGRPLTAGFPATTATSSPRSARACRPAPTGSPGTRCATRTRAS